jgi:hypothetical protein
VTEALAAESGRAKGPARERKNAVKRRLILVLSLGVAAAARADPAFGPGNKGVLWVIRVRRKASAILWPRPTTRLAASRRKSAEVRCGPGMAFPRPLFTSKRSMAPPDLNSAGYQGTPSNCHRAVLALDLQNAQRALSRVNDPRCLGEADAGDPVFGRPFRSGFPSLAGCDGSLWLRRDQLSTALNGSDARRAWAMSPCSRFLS